MFVDVVADAGKNDTHVMISYNWGSKETVLQLRDRLKTAGFKIWIDVEHMSMGIYQSFFPLNYIV